MSEHVADIEHQLWINSCGAHAGTTALEMLLSMSGKQVELDRLFTYYVLRDMAGYGDKDNGSRIRDIPKALKEIGCPPVSANNWLEQLLYFVGIVFGGWTKKPSSKRYEAAKQYRINDYERVADIRSALEQGRPVIVGMNLREAFNDCNWNSYSDSNPTFKHIMVVAGYADDAYLIVNSWGTSWGDGGMAWMPSPLLEADLYDAWSVSL